MGTTHPLKLLTGVLINPPSANLKFSCCVWVHLHQPLLLLPYLLLLFGLGCLGGEGREGEGRVKEKGGEREQEERKKRGGEV